MASKKTALEKVAPDEDNPGFFTVEGVSGHFRKDDAVRVAKQVSPPEEPEPGTHEAREGKPAEVKK